MLVIKQKIIYREDLIDNPHILYVFGDNLQRMGLGGQAGEMRGEPNAFGIATKRAITHGNSSDYFHDDEEDVIDILKKEFDNLGKEAVRYVKLQKRVWTWFTGKQYSAIVVPTDGLGTGLARLPELAPMALHYINLRLEGLKYIN